MKKRVKRIGVFILAIFFFVIGLIGLVLPFLQGILFLTISLLLLSMLSPSFRDKLEHHTRKWPRFHAWVVKAERWVVRVIGEV
ncbi:MAG: hypothetical protein KBD50_00075 [Candidatus Pacebacteria bacterium]|nr:hypothetical protein [Candidatus Paceibacterota bacterium]